MEENQNEDQSLDRYTKDYVEKGINKLLEEKELKIQWRTEIAENESVQTFFKNYNPSTIASFITTFINYKYMAYCYGDMYARKAETKRSRWINKAHEHLQYILLKKMFDLQCLWRADQIKLEGIEICFDFELWRQDVFNCPFLEPLEKVDIEHYQAYLLKSEEYHEFEIHDSQNYDAIKKEYLGSNENSDALSDWYEYHNLVTGNSSLLLLPDIRGEKELFYISYLSKKREQETPSLDAPSVKENLPNLFWFNDKDADFFIKTFDDRESQIRFESFRKGYKAETREDFIFENLYNQMNEEEENIPIEAHGNFKEALKKAFVKFRNRKIAEHLPLAHEQYLFNKLMGFELERTENAEADIRDLYIKQILKGREANGEPRDLNF